MSEACGGALARVKETPGLMMHKRPRTGGSTIDGAAVEALREECRAECLPSRIEDKCRTEHLAARRRAGLRARTRANVHARTCRSRVALRASQNLDHEPMQGSLGKAERVDLKAWNPREEGSVSVRCE